MERLRIGERGEIQKPYTLPNSKYRVELQYRDVDGKLKPLTAVGNTKGTAKSRLLKKWRLKSESMGHHGASDEVTLDQLLY